MKIIIVIIFFIVIAFLEIPPILKKKNKKELFVYILLYTAGCALMFLWSVGIKLPKLSEGIAAFLNIIKYCLPICF